MNRTSGLRSGPRAGNADVTEKLIAEFKKLIHEGVFKPGTKLPPERELARRFGVNRSSLRQALKMLQIIGVLSQRVGDGTYLSKDEGEILNQPLEFLRLIGDITDEELFEARLIVETELAARAAERATTADLAALRRAITDLGHSRDEQQRLDADIAFHDAIFRAAGNRVCQLIFRVIARYMLESMARVAERMDVAEPLAFHNRIYDAIHQRDPEAARASMAEHLSNSKTTLQAPPLPGRIASASREAHSVRPERRS